MKGVTSGALLSLHKELAELREYSAVNKAAFMDLSSQVAQVLALASRKFEHALELRERQLALSHELELAEAKNAMEERKKEIQSLNEAVVEKECKLEEQERLLKALHSKLESEKVELRSLHLNELRSMEEALRGACVEKEELQKANEGQMMEVKALEDELKECRERNGSLEQVLHSSKVEQQRLLKEIADKLQMEHKTELETIRSRFKLMAASTMERSPSDSSLEKIEVCLGWFWRVVLLREEVLEIIG